MASKTCTWVLATNVPCGGNVRYTMAPDGGEIGAPLVRQYKAFCNHHLAVRAARRPLNDPTVECCGRDAADCDCDL